MGLWFHSPSLYVDAISSSISIDRSRELSRSYRARLCDISSSISSLPLLVSLLPSPPLSSHPSLSLSLPPSLSLSSLSLSLSLSRFKRSGVLQWRVVHGIIATNRHRAHIDPQVGEECPFCGIQETVFHLFLNCSRLQQFFHQLEDYCQIMGEVFTHMLFIYGPKYSRSNN